MSDPTFDEAPETAPNRSAPAAFSNLTDLWLPWEKAFRNKLAAAVPWFRARTDEVAADAQATAEDRIATAADAEATAEDRIATGQDAQATAADLANFRKGYIGDFANDAAADAWGASEGVPIINGVFYYKNTAPEGLRLRSGGNWVDGVLDANGALVAQNNLSDLGHVPTAQENLGLKPAALNDYATKTEAETGLNNNKPMTPLRTAQAIAVLKAGNVVEEIFTSSSTFLKQDDDLFYWIEVIGAGGGGGHLKSSAENRMSGGRGGQVSSMFCLPDDLPNSVPVTVGAGGTGGPDVGDSYANGGAGGDSSFGSFTAKGGDGGDSAGVSSNNVVSLTKILPIPGQAWRGGYNDFEPYIYAEHAPSAGGSILRGTFDSIVYPVGNPQNYGTGGIGDLSVDGADGTAPGGGGGASRKAAGDGARGEVRVWRFKV